MSNFLYGLIIGLSIGVVLIVLVNRLWVRAIRHWENLCNMLIAELKARRGAS